MIIKAALSTVALAACMIMSGTSNRVLVKMKILTDLSQLSGGEMDPFLHSIWAGKQKGVKRKYNKNDGTINRVFSTEISIFGVSISVLISIPLPDEYSNTTRNSDLVNIYFDIWMFV